MLFDEISAMAPVRSARLVGFIEVATGWVYNLSLRNGQVGLYFDSSGTKNGLGMFGMAARYSRGKIPLQIKEAIREAETPTPRTEENLFH